MSNIAVLYPSCHRHTLREAKAVYRGALAVPSVNVRLYTEEEAAAQLDELDVADAIAFGCPTYEDSTTTPVRAMILRAAEGWTALAWKHRGVEVFATSSLHSGDESDTLVGLVTAVMQRSMSSAAHMGARSAGQPEDCHQVSVPVMDSRPWNGSLIREMAPSTKADLAAAERYGRRVAEITLGFAEEKESQHGRCALFTDAAGWEPGFQSAAETFRSVNSVPVGNRHPTDSR